MTMRPLLATADVAASIWMDVTETPDQMSLCPSLRDTSLGHPELLSPPASPAKIYAGR